MESPESKERRIHLLCPFLKEVNTSSAISLGNSHRTALVLTAELAFFAVQSADAHFLLLWCWFSIKVVMLNIDSRSSECSKTQLTGSHPSLLGCGEGREIFSSLKRTLSSEMAF